MQLRNSRNKNRRGQTLIIAIMVMFILAIVATVFIALVARNLSRSARSYSMDSVASIAEAGIRYADEMLTTSDEGADWRPQPDNLPIGLKNDDPDFQWLRPYAAVEAVDGSAGPSGGYTRFNSGQGRFLLRVSYNPNPKIVMSKYIKIEAIGRWGTIDVNDPTTLHDAGNFRLRREITAFKPIGITDYSRFITNKDDRSADIPLGVPGYTTNFGRASGNGTNGTSKYGERGGPIRVNGNLLWYGKWQTDPNLPSINIFLRGTPANDLTQTANDILPLDGVEVSGEIRCDSDPSNDANSVRVRIHQLLNGNDTTFDAKPSSSSSFTTVDGFYRDGSSGVDSSTPTPRPRGVKRLEPPLVDQPDPTNTTTRYRILTQNSGERVLVNGRYVNLGTYGWGKGIYINNTNDKQDNSDTLAGSYSLRADWMQPNNMMSTSWKGPYYVPPGVLIDLKPDDFEMIGGKKQYFFTITRTDVDNSGQRIVWYDPDGNRRRDWGQTIRMPYPDADRYASWRTPVPDNTPRTRRIGGNGVIYAEGNIRIRGMLPPGMKLTVVSNQNIYIEGNLLKYREPGKLLDAKDYDNYREADSTCGISLLARQNVVVNTTQFMSPLSNIGPDDQGADSPLGGNSYHLTVRNSPDSQFRCRFDFGPYESDTGNAPSKWSLFLRHSGEAGAAYINAWLNPTDTSANWRIMNLNAPLYAPLPPHVFGVGDPRFYGPGMSPGAGIGSSFIYNVFDLMPPITESAADLITGPGVPNILQIALDQAVYARSNYWMGGCAVLPMDVRIEAIMYAQEGSFFVIPGSWINPDTSDTDPRNRPPGIDPKFPLYGEPMDIRIIIDGAVTENMPAAIGDVEEWMAKWGRIPSVYGSTNEPTAHPGEGLTFLYDDHAGWPLDDNGNPIRVDAYGRALPITPKLPVCGSLIYFGDVM